MTGEIIGDTAIEKRYRKTLSNTKSRGTSYIASRELRDPYVLSCLQWGVDNDVLELEEVDDAYNQESGYKVRWIDL